MPQSPVPNCAQAVLNYQSDSGDARNVLHFQQAPDFPFDNINLEALALAVHTWWTPNLRPHVSTTHRLESIITRDMGQVPGEIHERVVNELGGNTAARTPSNVTSAFTLRTGQGGRSGRGRIFHVALSSGYFTGDTLTAGDLANMLTAYNALKVLPPVGSGPEFQLVVVSRFANGVQRPTGIKNRVTAITNDGILDSQRRRLKGRGA